MFRILRQDRPATVPTLHVGILERAREGRRPSQSRAWAIGLLGVVFLGDLYIRSRGGSDLGAVALYVLPCVLSSRRSPLVIAATGSVAMLTALILSLTGMLGPRPSEPALDEILRAATTLFAMWVAADLANWRHRFDSQVISSHDSLATILRSIADAVITTDAAGRVMYMNPSAANLTGMSPALARGRPLEDVFIELPVAQGETPRHTIRVPDGTPRETLIRSTTGTEIPVEATSSMLRDASPENMGKRLSQVVVFRDITERKQRHERVEHLAFRDALTGLPNRVACLERLDLELAHARRARTALSVLFIDLDGFKAVNDTYGHNAGDVVLRTVAQRMSHALRQADTVARLAGDEFVVMLPEADAEDSAHVAEKLCQAVSEPIDLDGDRMSVTPSIGIASFPDDAEECDELLRIADKAMYRAKNQARRHLETA